MARWVRKFRTSVRALLRANASSYRDDSKLSYRPKPKSRELPMTAAGLECNLEGLDGTKACAVIPKKSSEQPMRLNETVMFAKISLTQMKWRSTFMRRFGGSSLSPVIVALYLMGREHLEKADFSSYPMMTHLLRFWCVNDFQKMTSILMTTFRSRSAQNCWFRTFLAVILWLGCWRSRPFT